MSFVVLRLSLIEELEWDVARIRIRTRLTIRGELLIILIFTTGEKTYG